MKILKKLALRLLIYCRLYPHIFFTFMPFKIYEFKELTRGVEFSKDEVTLDIGCGGGLQTLLLGKRCKKVVGIDVSEKSIEFAKLQARYMGRRANTEFGCVKLEDAGFESEYFDKIFSVCVLEHIPNYVEVLREVYRVLKKNGQMIFSVDALETIDDEELIEKHTRKHFVEKYFRKDELKTILEEIGFKRINVYPIFKSDFAKRLFIKGINSRFQYGYLRPILAYLVLRHKESQCVEQNKGIFLIARCYK